MENIEYIGNGVRIDLFLTKKLEYSRNFFHHLFDRGGILVNNKQIKKSYRLKNGDIIQIDDLKRFLSAQILDEAPDIDLDIKLEKKDYMIIYKPKGVLSHPNSVWDVKNPSVVGFLYHKFKNLPSVGDFIRSGLIHRLDKKTDGLMLIIKTEKGLNYFKELFVKKSLSYSVEDKEKVSLKKFYRAVVVPNSLGDNFISQIDNFPYYINEIVKTKGVHLKEFKEGITKILSIKELELNKKIIDLEILTGRTHQIRYHLSTKGLPIEGDELYGDGTVDSELKLTAYRLDFCDIDGEYISISI